MTLIWQFAHTHNNDCIIALNTVRTLFSSSQTSSTHERSGFLWNHWTPWLRHTPSRLAPLHVRPSTHAGPANTRIKTTWRKSTEWNGLAWLCGGLGCHICTAGIFFTSSLHWVLKSGAEAAPYSATILAWLEFPLTSGYLICYCLNTNEPQVLKIFTFTW